MKRGKVLFLGTVCAAFLQIRRIESSVQLPRHEYFIAETVAMFSHKNVTGVPDSLSLT